MRAVCGSVAVFCVRSRLLFAAQRQTDRLAMCHVPIPAWVGIACSAFSCVGTVIEIRWFNLGLRVFCRRFRRGTRNEGGYTKKSTALGRCFSRYELRIRYDTAGSTLGLRAPDCAKETSLPGLSSFDSRPCALYAGSRVRFYAATLFQPRFPPGVRWGLECGSRTATAPKPAPKSHWLSGLSSLDAQCGCTSHRPSDLSIPHSELRIPNYALSCALPISAA